MPGLRGPTPTRSPRPTRRTTRPAPARSTSGRARGHRGRRGGPLPLPADGRRTQRGPAQGVPDRPSAVPEPRAAGALLDGVEVVDERPYGLDDLPRPTTIYDFGLRHSAPLPDSGRELFQEAVAAVWDDRNEVDGFNALVLAAGLTQRQAVLRAYAKYMRQGGTPFAQDYIEDALKQNVDITRLLVALFEARFDRPQPGQIASDSEARVARTDEVEHRIGKASDDVVSLDHDRILAVLPDRDEGHAAHQLLPGRRRGEAQALHLVQDPSRRDPDLPEPRPKFEIFVYSLRVEGVHLRFGAVRTRRPALVGPPRRLPHRGPRPGEGADGEERRDRAGRGQGRVLLQAAARPERPRGLDGRGRGLLQDLHLGLLDITDNLVGEGTILPDKVVRHDGDDAYLVVAAGKGTATFSDIANGVAKDYGFWLGDAFASGGSVGYDHKAMGITARGAWSPYDGTSASAGSTARPRTSPVSASAMSGDVFGNGMLPSSTLRLVAAFDHRDIFLDPDPDSETSYAERRRLFDLPRSSWQTTTSR